MSQARFVHFTTWENILIRDVPAYYPLFRIQDNSMAFMLPGTLDAPMLFEDRDFPVPRQSLSNQSFYNQTRYLRIFFDPNDLKEYFEGLAHNTYFMEEFESGDAFINFATSSGIFGEKEPKIYFVEKKMNTLEDALLNICRQLAGYSDYFWNKRWDFLSFFRFLEELNIEEVLLFLLEKPIGEILLYLDVNKHGKARFYNQQICNASPPKSDLFIISLKSFIEYKLKINN